MKKKIQKILLALLCLVLCCGSPVYGAAMANLGIQNDRVFFRLKQDFEISSDNNYLLLVFGETKWEDDRVWVYVSRESYRAETLEEEFKGKSGQLQDVPMAENIAVKLFEGEGAGWKESLGLCKSSQGFSKDSYEIQVSGYPGGTEEGTPGEESLLEFTLELKGADEDGDVYILMGKDKTILPLELAAQLYGFETEAGDETISFHCEKGLFSEIPALFSCTRDSSGIQLQQYGTSVLLDAQKTPEPTASPAAASVTATPAAKPEVTLTAAPTAAPAATSTPTAAPTPTATATPTPEPTATPTPEPTATPTPEPTATPTPEPTATPTPEPTATPTPEPTATPTPEPTDTPTPEPTATPTPEPTATPTPEPTATPMPTATATPTPEPELSPTASPEAEYSEEVTPVAPESQVTPTPTPEAIELPPPEEETEESQDQHLFQVFEGMNGYRMLLLAGLLLLVLALLQYIDRLKKNSQETQNKKPVSSDDEETVEPVKTELQEEKFTVQGAVANNKGRVRSNNEDNFYFNGPFMAREKMDEGALASGSCKDKVQLYAVCDGMGGTDSGEEASYGAARSLASVKQSHERLEDKNELTGLLRRISDNIHREASKKGKKSGTTIAMLLVNGKKLTLANVGDSRIYRLRKGELHQMSLDHSKVQRMVSMGILTPEQAKKDPSRHVITQYLGMPPEVKIAPYIVQGEGLRNDDVYLLCSDGLTDMVEDGQIEGILREKKNPQEAAVELLKTALRNGGRDNVTVMILKIRKEAPAEKKKPKKKSGRKKKTMLEALLFGATLLTGAMLLASVADFIYYLI